ncbi:MAG: YifB family Mg chelatase-like AAA ATPase [Bacteroidota bacterium]
MLIKTYGSAIHGIHAIKITIEVNISQGIRFFIVGLADHAIRESQQRIETAIINNNYQWPRYRIVINMAPADIRKEGTHFDLPLAIGILAASKQVFADRLKDYLILGELSLDGSVMAVKGVLPMALNAKECGFKGVIVPEVNAGEASVVEGLEVIPVPDLNAVVSFLNGMEQIAPIKRDLKRDRIDARDLNGLDYAQVKGQEAVKRALLIASAGSHNLLMVGAPGSGKTMMARRLPTILPPMTLEESIQTTRVHSVVGKMGAKGGLVSTRPFRSPHHSISDIALIGGGASPKPGEISLAHNGVLFLDELPEFKRNVLEVLRQPLEERIIQVSRANYTVVYPANFMLVASMNPCPCGYYNHPKKECNCGPGIIKRYLSRISGPLLDRIDMHLEVTPVSFKSLSGTRDSENSKSMRDRVLAVKKIQEDRFKHITNVYSNSQMESGLLSQHCVLDRAGQSMIGMALESLKLSARSYNRILKVARTIADLEESKNIRVSHVSEAVTYRNLDREGWSG